MKIALSIGTILIVVWLASRSVSHAGETTADPASAPKPTSDQPVYRPPPIVEPENRLAGKELVAALRKGGYVLYVRHTETGTVTTACDRSNLSPAGESQAERIGAAMRALRIPVGQLFSSPACRVQDTARLLKMGTVVTRDELNQKSTEPTVDLPTVRQKFINTAPPPGTNTVMVSHVHGSVRKDQWLHLEFGETIVFRPVANAERALPVARIPADEWANLARDWQ